MPSALIISPISISNILFNPFAIRRFLIMPQKRMKTSAFRRPAKRRKMTRPNDTTDAIYGSFKGTVYSVHQEADKLMPVPPIPDMLKCLLINNHDTHILNRTDDIEKLQVDTNILNSLKYLINLNLTEALYQMNDKNNFADRIAFEVFERMR